MRDRIGNLIGRRRDSTGNFIEDQCRVHAV